MSYVGLSRLLFAAILGLSCLGVVTHSNAGAQIIDGRYFDSYTNDVNYVWTIEIVVKNQVIIKSKITTNHEANNISSDDGNISSLEFDPISGRLSGWLNMMGTSPRKIYGKFPKIRMWSGGIAGGAKWNLVRQLSD